jgi:hypothetical protein
MALWGAAGSFAVDLVWIWNSQVHQIFIYVIFILQDKQHHPSVHQLNKLRFIERSFEYSLLIYVMQNAVRLSIPYVAYVHFQSTHTIKHVRIRRLSNASIFPMLNTVRQQRSFMPTFVYRIFRRLLIKINELKCVLIVYLRRDVRQKMWMHFLYT